MKRIRLDSFDPCLWFGLEYWLCTEDKPSDGAFLLWGTDPCVMLGKFQNYLAEVNRPYAEQNGITVVRRMSGGGAIYTDRGGRQFTFAEPAEGGITFEGYLSRISDALCKLGFPVEISGRNDLLAGGKKFSGNAQYRMGGMCVHHGSLLFDTDLSALSAATTPDEEKLSSKGISSVRERVCNLKDFAPSDMTVYDFDEALGALLCDGERVLTEAELARVREIANEKFRCEVALLSPDPKCTLTRQKRFPGGRLCAEISLKGHKIQGIVFSGDVFGRDTEEFCRGLEGISYTEKSLLESIHSSPFFGITRDELIELLKP